MSELLCADAQGLIGSEICVYLIELLTESQASILQSLLPIIHWYYLADLILCFAHEACPKETVARLIKFLCLELASHCIGLEPLS